MMMIDEALNELLTCAPTADCRHEQACFLVARTLSRLRREQVVGNEPAPELVVKHPEPLPELTIPPYVPTWESPRPILCEGDAA